MIAGKRTSKTGFLAGPALITPDLRQITDVPGTTRGRFFLDVKYRP